MYVTGDQSLLKQINKFLVLKTIKEEGPLSRAQTSTNTGLNKGTVSSLVSELIDEDLIYEIGPGQSSGGRRPVMLMFNAKSGFSIGIDLGVNYVQTILTDLNGEILIEDFTQLQTFDYDQVLKSLQKKIENLISRISSSRYGLVGIGIGVPGITNDNGEILFAPNLNWHNVHLKQDIEKMFHVPVIIDNEANAGVYGENKYGHAQQVSDVIYLSVGIGIGSGIMINNQLFKGASGFSGEVGHFSIETNGFKCSCGNKGCWELYASEKSLLTQAKHTLNPVINEEKHSLEHLLHLANEGHPEVIHLFTSIGEYLGLGISNLINTFNPEMVIIGNRMSEAERWLYNPLKRVVDSRSLPYHSEGLQIKFSNLLLYSTSLGASSFAIDHFFKQIEEQQHLYT